MTAKELDTMTNAMRSRSHHIESRMDLEDNVYYLVKGLRAIKRNKLADELIKLMYEIDDVPTSEVVAIGTFR